MGGEHEFHFHNPHGTGASKCSCSWASSDPEELNPGDIDYKSIPKVEFTNRDRLVYKKLRREIVKFVKICYLKVPSIKEYLKDDHDFQNGKCIFDQNNCNIAKNIEDLKMWASYREDRNFLKMFYDIAKLLILAFPGKICINFERSGDNSDFAEGERDWYDGYVPMVKFTKIPFFYYFRIPDIDSSLKFYDKEEDVENFYKNQTYPCIYNNRYNIRKKFTVDFNKSPYIRSLCCIGDKDLKCEKFNLRYIEQNNIKLDEKQKLLINFFKDQNIPIDIIDLIMDDVFYLVKMI